jgi:hypothetical protein
MKNTTTKHMKLTLVALAMSAVFLLPGVAGADPATADECNPEMQLVFTAINDGMYMSMHRDGTFRDKRKLHYKWHEAVAKINLGKLDNAVDKLIAIRDKASDLVEAPKPKLDDDTAISIAVDAAIGCLAP